MSADDTISKALGVNLLLLITFVILQASIIFLTAIIGPAAIIIPPIFFLVLNFSKVKITVTDFCKFIISLSIFKNFFYLSIYSLFYPEATIAENRIFVLSIDFQIFLILILLIAMQLMHGHLKISFFAIYTSLAIVIYFFLGALNADVISAITYLRVYFAFIFAVILARYVNLNELSSFSFVLLCVVVLLFLFQFTPNFWQLFTLDNFFDLKYGLDHSKSDYISDVDTKFFHYRITRFLGFELHPISAGYSALFLFAAASIRYHKTVRYFLPVLIVMILLSSKGAFAGLIFLVVMYHIQSWYFRLFVALSYTVLILAISSVPGLTSGYEHLLGLLGGFSQMQNSIIGNGIGYGGTQSSIKGFGFGGESGLGFVMSHFGYFGLIGYLVLLISTLRSALSEERPNVVLIKSLTFVLFVNGILQEEALFFATSFPVFLMYSIFKAPLKT